MTDARYNRRTLLEFTDRVLWIVVDRNLVARWSSSAGNGWERATGLGKRAGFGH